MARQRCVYLQVKDDEREAYENFLKLNSYISGSYDKPEDFERLHAEANKIAGQSSAHRYFYLALPPSVYDSVSELISKHCRPESYVVELHQFAAIGFRFACLGPVCCG